MTFDWGTKRKIIYLSVIGAVVFIIAGIVLFVLFYNPPSCSDGSQNQDETGVDCGGVCQRICPNEVTELRVLWERALPVDAEQYNLVAFIDNPNENVYTTNYQYEFRIYDKNNVILDTVTGSISVPPDTTFAVFEGNHQFAREPARTTFTFTGNPVWLRASDKPEASITISEEKVLSHTTAPRVEALVRNTSVQSIRDLELIAIVYDIENNAMGASRTVIEELGGSAREKVTFTWPEPFRAGTKLCEQPADVMLVIDRSGSMNDDAQNPPQPLTAVKENARDFIDKLANKDKAGVVSFASMATYPVDMELTHEFNELKNSIDEISITPPDNEQHTNIADGIRAARVELVSDFESEASEEVIVLLTDGIATRPLPPSGSTTDPEEYPKQIAREEAQQAEEEGIDLYVIGLGSGVDSNFLEELTSASDRYFYAPNTDELDRIYEDIATSICKRGPAIIRVLPRVRR